MNRIKRKKNSKDLHLYMSHEPHNIMNIHVNILNPDYKNNNNKGRTHINKKHCRLTLIITSISIFYSFFRLVIYEQIYVKSDE